MPVAVSLSPLLLLLVPAAFAGLGLLILSRGGQPPQKGDA